jgi:hypothetical protein
VWLVDPRAEADTDQIYRRINLGQSGDVAYAAIFYLPANKWLEDERVSLSGPGWQAVLTRHHAAFPKIEDVDGEPRVVEQSIRRPSMLVAVGLDGPPTAQRASRGRERLETLTGALSLLLHYSLFAAKAWEGFLEQTTPGKLRFDAVRTHVEMKRPDPAVMRDAASRARSLDPASLPEPLARALRWYARGAAEADRVDAFISYWLATLLIIQNWHRENVEPPTDGGEHPVRRQVRDYLRQRMSLDGGEEEGLFKRINSMYQTRHRIFKGSQLALDVKDVLVAETTCRRLLDFELRLSQAGGEQS